MISVPVLTPRLSSLWLGLVAPVYARVGRKLVDSLRYPTVVRDASAIQVKGSPKTAFAPIRRIGGTTGWYFANFLWRLRGFLDLLAGGVGLRRGRRDPETLQVGDTLDFWRVEAFDADQRLRLAAEMKVPGRAWLEFEVTGDCAHSTIRQTAVFDPLGLFGLIYWYALYPFHRWIYAGMLRKIAEASLPAADAKSSRAA